MNPIAAALLAVTSCALTAVLILVPGPRVAIPAVHASKTAAAEVSVDYRDRLHFSAGDYAANISMA